MKKLFFVFTLLIFCFAGAIFAQAQENSHTLRGVIKNQDSAVISGLRMVFKNNEKKTSTFTDINGDFDIRLAPGRYELTVSKSVSDKFIAFINIEEKGLNPNFLEFFIDINPNSCEDSSGNCCPKIIKFAKPGYPAAARAVRAMGEVVVIVKIDKEGKVVSAKAISGHPLLRAASEQAALKSAFEPSENAAEREGKLTFVFFDSAKEKKDIKRYSVPCRVEIIFEPPTFDITETE